MKNRGITLVALVITIIVLLILAGVSVSLVLGDKGVISNSKKAEIETRGASVEEQVELRKLGNKIAKIEERETYESIRDRLYREKLLIEDDIKELGKPENINKEITIGSRTISFLDTNSGIEEEKDILELVREAVSTETANITTREIQRKLC